MTPTGRQSIGSFPDRTSAARALRAASARVDAGLWSEDKEPAIRGRMETFEEFATSYAAMTNRLKPSTRRNYFTHIRQSLARFGPMPLDAIEARDVDRWWRDLADRPVNRRNAYGAMRRIIAEAVKRNRIRSSPCTIEGAFASVAERRPDHSRDEFEQVLAVIDEQWRPILRVLLASSARLGEVVGLNVGDYDDGRVHITKQHDGRSTKTGKSRTVRLLLDGRLAVEEVLRSPALPSAPLFRGADGDRLHPAALRRAWIKACAAAGVEGFHLHDLRHIGGTEAAHAGASIRDIMTRLWHTTLAAAIQYQHSSSARQDEVADAIDATLERRAGKG
jgi:integrase